MAKLPERARQMLRSQRNRAEEAANAARLTRLVSSFVLGMATKPGNVQHLAWIPPVMGSRLATIALGAGAVGYFADGVIGEVASGVAESAANVALYQAGHDGMAAVSGPEGRRGRLSPGQRDAVREQLADLVEQARDNVEAG